MHAATSKPMCLLLQSSSQAIPMWALIVVLGLWRSLWFCRLFFCGCLPLWLRVLVRPRPCRGLLAARGRPVLVFGPCLRVFGFGFCVSGAFGGFGSWSLPGPASGLSAARVLPVLGPLCPFVCCVVPPAVSVLFGVLRWFLLCLGFCAGHRWASMRSTSSA